MDMEFPVDLSESFSQIETSDVLTVCFPMLRKALVVDLRVNAMAQPLIKVVYGQAGDVFADGQRRCGAGGRSV